eukprot:TRINITY_DN1956_c0_g3_i1.p1 TRINITY_DN1956_c0_g3~~TRINITY_DN1956_c0_g3_i1.p1  ORF type:complete len:128 (-),score=6.19 TRINITY_DN1956_c0_g3_i1:52-435(-)
MREPWHSYVSKSPMLQYPISSPRLVSTGARTALARLLAELCCKWWEKNAPSPTAFTPCPAPPAHRSPALSENAWGDLSLLSFDAACAHAHATTSIVPRVFNATQAIAPPSNEMFRGNTERYSVADLP